MLHSTYHWIHSMDFMQQKADALTQSGVFSGIEWRVDQHAETLFAGRSGVQDVQTESGILDVCVKYLGSFGLISFVFDTCVMLQCVLTIIASYVLLCVLITFKPTHSLLC